MLHLFSWEKSLLSTRTSSRSGSGQPRKTNVDNFCWFLYNKVTVAVLSVSSILLGCREYYGNPINCTSDGIPEKILDSYCWITGTWTIKELADEALKDEVMSPGVGLYDPTVHTAVRHTYYQWVPLVLAAAAVRFYAPRFLWKLREGGKIEHVTRGLTFQVPCGKEHGQFLAKALNVLSTPGQLSETRSRLAWFLLCEALNPLNVVLELMLASWFLEGHFGLLGDDFLFRAFSLSNSSSSISYGSIGANTLRKLFPKVTMCTFRKYGSSGKIQLIQGICILPLNVVNEKIFCLLWFWYFILFTMSSFLVAYRMAYLSWAKLRIWVLKVQRPLSKGEYSVLLNKYSAGQIFLLQQLSMNVSSECFQDLVSVLVLVKAVDGQVVSHAAVARNERTRLMIDGGILFKHRYIWHFMQVREAKEGIKADDETEALDKIECNGTV